MTPIVQLIPSIPSVSPHTATMLPVFDPPVEPFGGRVRENCPGKATQAVHQRYSPCEGANGPYGHPGREDDVYHEPGLLFAVPITAVSRASMARSP
jgi:hypothetical protein